MKNFIKKSAATLIAGAMLLTGGVGASAIDTSVAVNEEKSITVIDASLNQLMSESDLSAMMGYAEDILPIYLGSEYDKSDNISISQPMKVYNTSSYYIFVFCNDEIIAKLKIGKNNGEFFSVFDYCIDNSIKRSYENGIDVNFVNYNGNIYMFSTDDKSYCIDQSATVNPENAIMFKAPTQKINNEVHIQYEPVNMTKDIISLNIDDVFSYNVNDAKLVSAEDKVSMFENIVAAIAANGNSVTANASYVKNTTYNGKYICWAACTAMSINCKFSKSLSATDIAKAVADSGLETNGSIDCVKKSYSLYGYTVVDSVATAISGSEMYYYISNNFPVQINIKNESGTAHAITIYGVELSNNTVKYYFIDPSRKLDNAYMQMTYTGLSPSQVYDHFPYTGINDDGSDITYTTWYRTYR